MENSEKGYSRRRCGVVWEKEVKILWYVIQTKSGWRCSVRNDFREKAASKLL